MRIYKRGKYWWCAWTEGGLTLRRSTRCTTRRAAEIVSARWERERADPAYHAANTATLGAEARTFLDECKADGLRPGTLNMYDCKVAHVCRLLGANTRTAAITPPMVIAYIAQRRVEGASDSTIYKEWVALRGILNSARHRGRYARDPGALKPPRFSPSYEPRQRFLSWAELGLLCLSGVLPLHRAQAVAFIVATGARRAEFRAAQAHDVTDRTVHLHGTKTDSSNRVIPVPATYQALLAFAGPPPFDPWTNARRDLEEACARAGVEPVTFNDLRRTFASLLVQEGVAPHLVGKLMGHTTSAMVERVYGRQSTEALARLIDGPLAYQTPALQDAPDGPSEDDSPVNRGPTGTRTRDLRIKRPASPAAMPAETGDMGAGVPPAYQAPAPWPWGPARKFLVESGMVRRVA